MALETVTAVDLELGDEIDWFGVRSRVDRIITRTDGLLILEHTDNVGVTAFLTLAPDSVIDRVEKEE